MDKLYVARIVESTSTDGVGLRNSLYVSGCHIHCPGCHNKDWWSLKSGKEMDVLEVYELLSKDDFNISILGGEPLMQYPAILKLCKLIKKTTNKTIWLWTGYEMPYLECFFGDLLKYVDVVVDGPFKAELADRSLHFRGSSNQQIYEVKHTPHICITNVSELYK
jgi:anaerobic ribonucleoside-triphosphate reductase activating protein